MEGNSYKSVSKQLKHFMKNDTFMKKQIQETMKESGINNTNTHAYMLTAVNMVFTQMHVNTGIKLFGERTIATMIK